MRLAAGNKGWLVRAPGDVDRIEACFSGVAYAPHRHDTYAIGITLKGVQSFDYRGVTRYSLPGQLVVLHPDELHDGRAGDDAPFRYRTAYIAPADIQGVLGGRPLPFVQGAVSNDPRLARAICALLEDYDRPLTGLAYQDALYDLAIALLAVSGASMSGKIVNHGAALRARAYIESHLARSFSLNELERVTHHDRWQLSRDFRATFGTSPHRYLILRRLDQARRMMLEGHASADAAAANGFSDQSHFVRHFRKAFGLTPNAWLNVIAHNRSIPLSPARIN